jgi:hypothetical protein
MNKLSLILLLCLISSVLFSQNQVLTRQNGGASWQKAIGGGSNVRAVRTSNQTISSSINTTVTFSSEDFDLNSEFDPSTGVFTPSEAGYYKIMATANWDVFNGNSGTREIRLVKRTGVSSTVLQKTNSESGSGQMVSSLHTVVCYDGSSGHSFYVEAFQNSVASHDIGGSTAAPGCTFNVYRL